jgi:hypothetical protein
MRSRTTRHVVLCLVAALFLVLGAVGCGSDGEFGGDAVDAGDNASSLPVTMPSLPTATQPTTSGETNIAPLASLSGEPLAGKKAVAKAGCGSCHTLQGAGFGGASGA